MSQREVLTLDELKARNKENEDAEAVQAEAEAKAAEEAEDAEADLDEGYVEEKPEADTDESADDEDSDDDSGEDSGDVEEWMKDDDGKPAKQPAMIPSVHAKNLRKKLKGEIAAQQEEIDRINAENEQLRSQYSKPPEAQPQRENFHSDIEYLEARQDWKIAQNQYEQTSKSSHDEIQKKRTAIQKKSEEAVDDHYVRAEALIKKSKIDEGRYQQADSAFRRALEQRFPGAGEGVADSLIARIGSGSERVVFNLGVNSKRLTKLIEKFNEDESGLSAAVYLGELNTELNPSVNNRSKAPNPASQVSGDNSANPHRGAAMKRRYKEAHKLNDTQGAFNAKKEAKAQGINVSDW